MAHPTETDQVILALAITDRGAYGLGGAECVDLGAVFAQLSPGGRDWYRLATPDQVVRGALNCYWKFGATAAERQARATKGELWYRSYGTAWRRQVIEKQDQVRGTTCQPA